MNNNPNLSKSQLDSLMNEASKQSGAQIDQIKKAIETGNVKDMLNGLNPNDAKKVERALADKKTAEKLLSSPEAQKLINKLMGKNKK